MDNIFIDLYNMSLLPITDMEMNTMNSMRMIMQCRRKAQLSNNKEKEISIFSNCVLSTLIPNESSLLFTCLKANNKNHMKCLPELFSCLSHLQKAKNEILNSFEAEKL